VSFKREFKRLQKALYRTNGRKGFHEIDNAIDSLTADYGVPEELVQKIKQARISQKLMLVVSELAEAVEALRNGNPPDNHIPKFSGFDAETADAVIRLMNLSERDSNGRLADAIIAKAAYNSRRPKYHGGKKF